MYIKDIRIDRFGSCWDLGLTSLANGLHVIYGPPGSGKTTIAKFIRAALYGFDDQTSRSYLPIDSDGFGGALTLSGPEGRQILSRHEDGSLGGRLTVEHEDGTVVDHRHVPEAITELDRTTFDLVFAVDYRRRPGIGQLLQEARLRGFDLLADGNAERLESLGQRLQQQRDALATIPRLEATFDGLRARRAATQRTIEQLEAILEGAAQLGDVARQIQHLENRLTELQRELAGVQSELATAVSRRRDLLNQRAVAEQSTSDCSQWSEFNKLSGQLRRWRKVLGEVATRRRAIDQHEHEDQRFASTQAADPRRWLGELEVQLDDLQTTLADLNDQRGYQGHEVKALFAEVFGELRSNIYRLCNDVSVWELRAQRVEAARERQQLGRCETELRKAVGELSRRGLSLQASLVENKTNQGESLPPWHKSLCECADHPHSILEPKADQTTGPPDRELIELDSRIAASTRRREQLIAEIATVQSRLQELRSQSPSHDRAALLDQLDTARKDLRRIDQDLRSIERRRELLTEIQRVQAEMDQLRDSASMSPLATRASEYLSRLTGGDLKSIEIAADDQVWVADEHHRRQAFHQLSDGGRDLTYLALCLVIADAARRRGIRVPMIVNGLFSNVDARDVPQAAELLRDFAASGHQLLLFTRYEHVASVFRLLHAPVRVLEPLPQTGSHPASKIVNAPDTACEKTELAEPTLKLASAREAYGLSEHDPIEAAPFLDEANLSRLRRAGVVSIGELLRASVAELAAELESSGVTAERIRSWQAQARLLCYVPHLRSYDARLLVACGVTKPEQLNRLTPSELRAMVKDVAASGKGQSILLSGTEFELSRVTDWIASPSESAVDRREEELPTVVSLKGQAQRRFHLHRKDPVMDAPAIGPRMAERLEGVGVKTVADLLRADAEVLSERLNHRSCSARVVLRWQQQAALVCRVPELRGHDAQLLVALGVTTAEQLAACKSSELWPQIESLAGSKEGQRILRNAKMPDLEEVTDWIQSAAAARKLNAA